MFIVTSSSQLLQPIYGRQNIPLLNGAVKSCGLAVSINISPLRGSKPALLYSRRSAKLSLARLIGETNGFQCSYQAI